jgi:ABC-type transport system substrate-binding protein
VDVHTSDFSTLETDAYGGKFQIALFPPENGVNEVADPANVLVAYLSLYPGANPSSRLKALLEKVYTPISASERQKLYGEIQEASYSAELANWMPYIDLTSLNLVSDQLRGYSVMPSGHVRWEQVWLAN